MVILHVLSSDDKYGSAQCFLELLEYELKDPQITPIVITPKKNEINKKCDDLDVKNYCVDYGQVQIPKHNSLVVFLAKYVFHGIEYYLKRRPSCNRIAEIIKADNVDVIHTNSCVIDVGSDAAKITGKTNIWHLREFGKEDFQFYPARSSLIDTMNGDNNVFISISKAVSDTWIRRGIKKEKIFTIYDGVDSRRFLTPQNSRQNEVLKIVMCGSFCEAKNQKLLIEAIHLLSKEQRQSIHVDFFGICEGVYYQEVKELVEKYNIIDLVDFKGYVSNVPERLTSYDIGVLCSRSEAFGRVTAEYMMAGVCPIAPATGANVELINNDSGILYNQLTAEMLSDKLSAVLKENIDCKKLGREARIRALNFFDINKNSSRIIEFFKECAKERNSEDIC